MLGFVTLILAVGLVWLACKYLDLKKSLQPKEKRYSNLTNAISSMVDSVEGYDNAHAQEVAELSLKFAEKLGFTEEQKESLFTAAKLHDVGMLIVSNDSIKSRRKLDEDESFIMKNHSLLAEHYLKQQVTVTEDIPTIIRWHHERWDGFGYPDSLRGKQIPLPSRIITISDAISSMRSGRCYRKKHYNSDKEICQELLNQSGLQFDPSLVKIALDILSH